VRARERERERERDRDRERETETERERQRQRERVTLSDGSFTMNVVRLGLMLMGLILNVSGRPCIIGGCNDNDHM
jgi:hypothetical protein